MRRRVGLGPREAEVVAMVSVVVVVVMGGREEGRKRREKRERKRLEEDTRGREACSWRWGKAKEDTLGFPAGGTIRNRRLERTGGRGREEEEAAGLGLGFYRAGRQGNSGRWEGEMELGGQSTIWNGLCRGEP